MFHRFLICTDLADGMQRLVSFVPSLAAGGARELTFLHSVPLWEEGEVPREDTDKLEAARDFLSKAKHAVPDGVTVNTVVQSGKPIDTICNAVEKYQPDLILLGAERRTLLQEKLFGSTTISLVQRISTPLMILRPNMLSAYTHEELDLRCRHLFRYLLIPYNGGERSDETIRQFKRYAENRPADSVHSLMLCWVVDDSGRKGLSKNKLLAQARETLPGLKADLEKLDLQVDFTIRQGNPVVETLEAAEAIDVSAIAVSAARLGGLLELSSHSLTGDIVRRSFYPVIFLPYKR